MCPELWVNTQHFMSLLQMVQVSNPMKDWLLNIESSGLMSFLSGIKYRSWKARRCTGEHVEYFLHYSFCTDDVLACVCLFLVLGGDQWRTRHRPNRNLPWRQRLAAGQDQCVLQWSHWWVHPDTYWVQCLIRWSERRTPLWRNCLTATARNRM